MSLNDNLSLYDILDIKPDASPQEVREAYLRTKAAYGKDSVALYTLITPDERDDMLHRIQDAYEVLSNGDRRKEYDRRHGTFDAERDIQEVVRPPLNRKIISIDRVPPMEHSANSEDMLVAPSTDFTVHVSSMTTSAEPHSNVQSIQQASEPPPHQPVASQPPQTPQIQPRNPEAALAQEISQEIEWKGNFLRRVRDARRISIEELANITKVSKIYLLAIEEENYTKLPAPVFLRGFITQIAKTLRLPHDQVVSAYMARFQQARTDKTAK